MFSIINDGSVRRQAQEALRQETKRAQRYLELAGVILLMSLVGAIVIAKTKVPEESQAASG